MEDGVLRVNYVPRPGDLQVATLYNEVGWDGKGKRESRKSVQASASASASVVLLTAIYLSEEQYQVLSIVVVRDTVDKVTAAIVTSVKDK